MSRDRIEHGLGWSWTAPRVARAIVGADSNVLIAVVSRRVVGFGIMWHGEDDAHLSLLAVRTAFARRGIGRSLVEWLESSARVAGAACIRLESRTLNAGARAFYRRLGYAEVDEVPGYYQGREAAVRMVKGLRVEGQARA